MSLASTVFADTHTAPSRTAKAWWRPLAIAALGCSLIASAVGLAANPVAASEPREKLTDGVYVFGESPTAGQIGTTYMVMQVDDNRVSGGFYQPSSSFDCFYGEIADSEMALTVVDSYAQTEHPFALALESQTSVASQTAIAGEWVPSGFHPIADVSTTDREVLQTCSF